MSKKMTNFCEQHSSSKSVNILLLSALMTILAGNFCAAINTMVQKEKFTVS